MRLLLALTVTALLLGCHSTQSSRDEVSKIAEALERPITPDKARNMLLGSVDRDIQAEEARLAAKGESNRHLELLMRERDSLRPPLDSFLQRLREGDELWYYRTYVWEFQRGGEGGIAIVRKGKVVDHMPFFTFD